MQSSDAGCEIADLHLTVCRHFTHTVRLADGRWDRPTPCGDWNARAVVEHVIGFHDVLLLRPLGLKPDRPRHDVLRRWQLTIDRLPEAFKRHTPADLVPRLSQDVLVHTWDLARAVGADDRLDAGLCAMFLSRLPKDLTVLTASGMFAPPVPVDHDADAQSRLLAALGRDPSWPWKSGSLA